ncbi:unnamed protein product [Closterium sp. NIES-54]
MCCQHERQQVPCSPPCCPPPAAAAAAHVPRAALHVPPSHALQRLSASFDNALYSCTGSGAPAHAAAAVAGSNCAAVTAAVSAFTATDPLVCDSRAKGSEANDI